MKLCARLCSSCSTLCAWMNKMNSLEFWLLFLFYYGNIFPCIPIHVDKKWSKSRRKCCMFPCIVNKSFLMRIPDIIQIIKWFASIWLDFVWESSIHGFIAIVFLSKANENLPKAIHHETLEYPVQRIARLQRIDTLSLLPHRQTKLGDLARNYHPWVRASQHRRRHSNSMNLQWELESPVT